MKKIMFCDKYGLTEAVLEGRKTQTRRLLHCPKTFGGKYVSGFRLCTNKQGVQFVYLVDEDECEIDGSVNVLSAYKIGEEVAIAQSYKDAGFPEDEVQRETKNGLKLHHLYVADAGWSNKMFVKSDLMPHRIKITNIRVERLHDISDEDCLKEGVFMDGADDSGGYPYYYYATKKDYKDEDCFVSPREAFADIIDGISVKGTWKSNPYVFVYDFELVR